MGLSWGQLIGASNIKKYCNKIIDAANEAKKAANAGLLYGASSIMRVAVSMKLRFKTFDTNGNERDARRLHSITLTSLFLARY